MGTIKIAAKLSRQAQEKLAEETLSKDLIGLPSRLAWRLLVQAVEFIKDDATNVNQVVAKKVDVEFKHHDYQEIPKEISLEIRCLDGCWKIEILIDGSFWRLAWFD